MKLNKIDEVWSSANFFLVIQKFCYHGNVTCDHFSLLRQHSEKGNASISPRNRISSAILIFSRPTLSTTEYLQGICFLMRVYEYTEIKGLDSGKITSLLKARKWSTTRITSIIAENKTTCSSLASVASVSVRFRSKERGTRVKDRAKKWLSFHFSRGQNRKSCSSGFFGSETKRKRVSSLCMTP